MIHWEMDWMVDAVGGWLPLILLGLLFSVTVAYWRMASAGLPPGPWGLPGLGFLLSIDSKAPYETFSNLAQRYGPVYSLRLGGLLTVFVSDPQLIRRAFGQDVFSGRAPLYLTHGIMQGHGKLIWKFSWLNEWEFIGWADEFWMSMKAMKAEVKWLHMGNEWMNSIERIAR